MYYIIKTAIYDHGVMWIGENKSEGIREAERLMRSDGDNHHRYELRLFKQPKKQLNERAWKEVYDWQDQGELVYTACKDKCYNSPI